MKPKSIRPEHQELLKEIGNRIKKLRSDKKIGYIQMAKNIGLSRNSYNAIELGNVYWNSFSLLKITEYYNIPLEELFKGL